MVTALIPENCWANIIMTAMMSGARRDWLVNISTSVVLGTSFMLSYSARISSISSCTSSEPRSQVSATSQLYFYIQENLRNWLITTVTSLSFDFFALDDEDKFGRLGAERQRHQLEHGRSSSQTQKQWPKTLRSEQRFHTNNLRYQDGYGHHQLVDSTNLSKFN